MISYSTKHALGGSETALANLSKLFPSDYEIYVGGSVLEEKIENVTYINIQNLFHFIKVNMFHTIIVSRYIGFYEMFPNAMCYQSYIWGHDTELYGSGSNMNPNLILEKWSNKIMGCVCHSHWYSDVTVLPISKHDFPNYSSWHILFHIFSNHFFVSLLNSV